MHIALDYCRQKSSSEYSIIEEDYRDFFCVWCWPCLPFPTYNKFAADAFESIEANVFLENFMNGNIFLGSSWKHCGKMMQICPFETMFYQAVWWCMWEKHKVTASQPDSYDYLTADYFWKYCVKRRLLMMLIMSNSAFFNNVFHSNKLSFFIVFQYFWKKDIFKFGHLLHVGMG